MSVCDPGIKNSASIDFGCQHFLVLIQTCASSKLIRNFPPGLEIYRFKSLSFFRMQTRFGLIVPVVLALGQLIAFAGSQKSYHSSDPSPVRASSAQILGLPMQFERNAGQTDSQVQFLSRGPGYTLFLTPTEAVLSLRSSSNSPSQHRARDRQQGHSSPVTQTVMRMNLLGANPVAHIEATGNQSGTASYFIGQAPHQWHTGIPLFARVKYEQVYPGIDLVYYGNQRQLEYDFILAPRAAPEQIAIHFTGIDSLEI